MESLRGKEREQFSQPQLDMSNLHDIYAALESNDFPKTDWRKFGFNLGLKKTTLDEIEHICDKDLHRCLLECLSRWLKGVDYVDKKGGTTWNTLANALEEIGEKCAACNIREKVKEALGRYHQALSEALVKASQLLYSQKCIEEDTLDEMETLNGETKDKKTILLAAIHKSLVSNCEKLGVITSVMTKFKETKFLAENLTAQYGDIDISPVVQQIVLDTCSASEILQYHYGKLSQFLQDAIKVAELLCPQMLSLETMESIECLGHERIMLLQAIRKAVRTDKHNLELFVSALELVPQNYALAANIWKDCEKLFANNMQLYNYDINELLEDTVAKSQDEVPTEITIPRSMSERFMSIRMKYGRAIKNICHAITNSENLPPFSEVKNLLQNCFPYMKEKFDNCHSINDLLDVVQKKCTLINISCIEELVEELKIKDAEVHIQTYRKTIDEFCKNVSVTLCLQEKFGVANVPSPLQLETINLVLDWNPEEYTLEDIRDILSITFEKELSKIVLIQGVKTHNSIIVTCTFPLSLTTFLVAKAQKTVELVKMKGLIQLTIGYYIILEKEHLQSHEAEPIQSLPDDHSLTHKNVVTGKEDNSTTEASFKSDESISDLTTVDITPTWISNEIIFRQKQTALVLPVLLMFSGLPDSGKSEAIQKMLNIQEKTLPGFHHYGIIATGLSSNANIQAHKVDSHNLYNHGFLSGLKRHLALEAKQVGEFFNNFPLHTFKDATLEKHFCETVQCLHYTLRPSDEAQANRGLKKMKQLLKGAGIINVWDLTFNSTTLHFIRCFSGYLYNSYTWLFTDLERDVDFLRRPPTTHEGIPNMRMTRLEYIIQCSRLSSHFNTTQKDACTIFAKRIGKDDKFDAKFKKLEKECQHVAFQLNAQDIVNEKIIPIDFGHVNRSVLLEYLKKQIKRDYEEIPMSHIFLRGALHLEKSVFIRRDELKKKAKECNIGDKSFDEFCLFFTSFGSILDVSLVNETCDIVIIKPNEFLHTLDQAFNPHKIKSMPELCNNGIINQDLARTLFGDENRMFIEVLEAIGLVANVSRRVSNEYARGSRCFYMPSVRQSEEISKYTPNAVQLITSPCYPSINMELAISKILFATLPDATLKPSKHSNKTHLSIWEDDIELEVTDIEIIDQGGVFEFIVKSSKAKKIRTYVNKIITGCQEIAEYISKYSGEAKYHFAILCAQGKHLMLPYNFSCKRHILPSNELCDLCIQKGYLTEHIQAWNAALQRKNIPRDYKLNGDLTSQDVQMLVTQIATYPNDAIVAFKNELECPIHPLPLPKDSSKWWCVLMTVITKWMVEHPHKESTKKSMATILVKLHEQFKSKHDETRFKELARKLDLQAMIDSEWQHLEHTFALKPMSGQLQKNVNPITKCLSAPTSPALGSKQREELHAEQNK